MKTKNLVYAMVLIVILYTFSNIVGCASSKVSEATNNQILDSLVAKKNFQIESQTAYPQVTSSLISIANSGLLPPGESAGMINLSGNPNYLKMKGDSITAYLPYFGERQMGANTRNNNTGIKFDDISKEYSVEKGKNNSYIIRFTIPDKKNRNEIYNITLQLYPNMRSDIRVNSSQRSQIRYRGTISQRQ